MRTTTPRDREIHQEMQMTSRGQQDLEGEVQPSARELKTKESIRHGHYATAISTLPEDRRDVATELLDAHEISALATMLAFRRIEESLEAVSENLARLGSFSEVGDALGKIADNTSRIRAELSGGVDEPPASGKHGGILFAAIIAAAILVAGVIISIGVSRRPMAAPRPVRVTNAR